MTEEPTPEQIEAAAKAMSEASSGFFSEGSWRHLAREALVAAAGAAPQETKDLSIMNGWLVEAVGKHTCGAGMDGYGHEPGCGYVPVLNLAELDGYPAQVDEAKLAEAVAEELETDDAIAKNWSNGKVNATARRLVQYAVLPVLRGGVR